MNVLAMKLGHRQSCIRVGEDRLTCITEVATGDLACQREVSRGDCGVVVRGASAEVAHSVGDVSVGRSDGRGGKDAEVAHAVGDVCVGCSDGRGGKPESNGVSGR